MNTPVHIARTDAELIACFPVMRELRPQLKDAADFIAAVRRMETEGYALAYVAEGGKPVACMGFRAQEMLARGLHYYVDDLVTLPAVRSHGHGRTLLRWIEDKARAEGKVAVHLESGTQRIDAHRFYFRERMHVSAFHFLKRL